MSVGDEGNEPPPVSIYSAGVERPVDDSGILARWCFLRLLALAHLAAFISLWVQIDGLVGPTGIEPAADYFQRAGEALGARGETPWLRIPSLCWWLGAGSGVLNALCGAGVAFALALLLGFVPRLAAAALWVLYLSLFHAGGSFLSYQWDILLIEATLVAIPYAPWGLVPHPGNVRAPSRVAVWLVRLLWFKLMLSSGVVKLTSGDPTWADLSALDYHYWTQPIPHGAAWYAHNLPGWTRPLAVSVTFFGELVGPFLLFFNPRRWRLLVFGLVSAFVLYVLDGRLGPGSVAGLVVLAALLDDRVLSRVVPAAVPEGGAGVGSRMAAFWITVGLMGAIAGTGNYGFFHLLTIAVACSLLDDAAVWRLTPKGWRAAILAGPKREGPGTLALAWILAAVVLPASAGRMLNLAGRRSRAAIEERVKKGEGSLLDRAYQRAVELREPIDEHLRPFVSVNGYGLFATMTTRRFELVVEGSNDGKRWKPYRFHYKPQDPKAAPPVIGLHMPRLDWQMWFAALAPRCGGRAWFLDFLEGLLEGRQGVRALLAEDPFLGEAPRYVRVRRERWSFTDPETRAKTGQLWSVEAAGEYCPRFSLRGLRRARGS